MIYLQNAFDYLFQAIIAFALFVVLLRFWMQWVRANFRHQFGQFIIMATNPAVVPLRRVLPSIGNIDTATLVLAFGVALVKVIAYLWLNNIFVHVNPLQLFLFSLGVFIKYSIYLFLIAIFIQVIASWVNPYSYHPIVSLANDIANPMLEPARRLIPSIGGLDFSPILVILFLQFSIRLLVAPLLPFPI